MPGRGELVCLCMAAVVHVTVNAYIPPVGHPGARGVSTVQRCPQRGGTGGRAGAAPLLRPSQGLADCRESHASVRRLRGPGLQMAVDAEERVQKILPLYDGEYPSLLSSAGQEVLYRTASRACRLCLTRRGRRCRSQPGNWQQRLVSGGLDWIG